MKNKNIVSYFICFLLLVSDLFGGQSHNINHPNIKCPGGVFVNSFNGNMYTERNDLYIEGRKFNLNMTFYYNSNDHKRNFGYGNGWGFKYFIQYIPDSNGVTIRYADGFKAYFESDSNNANLFHPPTGIFDSLSQYQPGKYVLITKNKTKYFFNDSLHRRLTRCEEPNGNFLGFAYTDSLITQVTDPAGRSIQLGYSGGRLTTITDALDSPIRTIQYSYDSNNNLVQVTDPAGNTRKYSYLVNGPMSTVTNRNGNTVDIIYQSNFAVKEVISCITDQRISYNGISKSTYLVEANGNNNQVTFYKYDDNGNLKQKTGNCCGYNVSYEYDSDRNITLVTDANGNKTQFTYDGKGNMLTKKDAAGSTSHYAYEPNFNKVITFTNRNGNTTSYTYDVNGNHTQTAYPMGVTNTYTYAANGDLTGMIDGNGNNTTYNYNINGDLTSIHHPLGVNHTFNYNSRGHLISYTDPRGNSSSIAYDVSDRITAITDALSHPMTFTYDANNNLLSLTNRNNHTFQIGYDALDRAIIFTNALNNTSHFIFDAKSNLISSTDANGNTTKYSYDNLNRLIFKTNAANETTSYNYDDGGNITSVAYPNGNAVNYTYDALNRKTGTTDNIGMLFTRVYDNIGNVISQSDANGNTRSYGYDALNRRIGSNDPLGNTSLYSYDDNFNLTSFTDRNSNNSTYSYDALNRLTNYTDALSSASAFAYDAAGNLTTVTDANSHITAYTYDALNRNTIQTFADATTNIYTYDNNGNVISRTDNNSAVTNYTYDDNDRLVTRDFPGSNDDVFTYDAKGRMVSASNNNAIEAFTYDVASRKTSETLNGKTTSYMYDIPGRKKAITYPGGRIINRFFDTRRRLTEIKEGNSSMAAYTYDAVNKLTQKNYGNGTFTAYIYDAKKMLISMNTNPGGLLHFEYGYDNMGNKLFEKKQHRPDHSEQYSYDNKYQLADFKTGTLAGNSIPSPLHHNQYNYDALGNRTSITEDAVSTAYTVNNMNAYTAISGVNQQYDNNGNLVNDGTFTYSYDAQNRLIAVNNGSVASYQYDALGRRTRKTVGANVTDFVYAGVHEIENRDGASNVKASYVFGIGIDNVLSSKINGTDYFYYKNALGSVSALGNNAGNIVERYEYDPCGSVNIYDNNYNPVAASSTENSIYYTGRSYDSEIDKYYYRARHFDPIAGRFMQHDPLKYIDGLSMYAYVGNNVLNRKDPAGTVAPLIVAGAVVLAEAVGETAVVIEMEAGIIALGEGLVAAIEAAAVAEETAAAAAAGSAGSLAAGVAIAGAAANAIGGGNPGGGAGEAETGGDITLPNGEPEPGDTEPDESPFGPGNTDVDDPGNIDWPAQMCVLSAAGPGDLAPDDKTGEGDADDTPGGWNGGPTRPYWGPYANPDKTIPDGVQEDYDNERHNFPE